MIYLDCNSYHNAQNMRKCTFFAEFATREKKPGYTVFTVINFTIGNEILNDEYEGQE